MRIKDYDRQAAVAYARKWALGRNPAYYSFDALGGDCTNFVSQCLYAGAGIMNRTPVTGWYYRSASDRTASWTGVRFLYEFLTRNRSAGPFAHTVPRHMAQPGDVVQLGNAEGGFYHSGLISAVFPELLVCAHSADARDRPLRSWSFAQARFLHIDGVRKN